MDRAGVFGMAERGVAEQGVDGGEPPVARADRVVPSCSRWSKNAVITGASRSAMSSADGVLPVLVVAKRISSRNVVR